MSPADVEYIWKDFDSDLVPFSNLVRRFIMADEFDKIRKIKEEIRLGSRFFCQIWTFLLLTAYTTSYTIDKEINNELTNRSYLKPVTKRRASITSVHEKFKPIDEMSIDSNYLIKKAKISVKSEKNLMITILHNKQNFISDQINLNWSDLKTEFQRADQTVCSRINIEKAVVTKEIIYQLKQSNKIY